jgi:hypothetical protein
MIGLVLHGSKTQALRLSILCLLVMASCEIGFAQSQSQSGQSQRQLFGLDSSFENPVYLSKSVLGALISSKGAGQVREWIRQHPEHDLSYWFKAKQVHLTNASEVDFAVLGTVPGGDCNQFWVVRQLQGRPQVVLFAGANTLEILASKHGGVHDIRVDWWGGRGYGWAELYRFNGSRYVPFRRLDTYRDLK